ncbi:MAG TPA: hypothetical protein PK537_10735 [Candidatus Limiplasma sp.]|nr:hypothetical protein [Candidatus Limiplasma sp.]
MITCYADFIATLQKAGFSMGGGNTEGIYSIINWSWNEAPPYPTPVRWHTGDPDTDPWEWRMRVLEGRSDIAYAKLFFKKSGYITADWYPYFLTVRRQNKSFSQAYQDGTVSFEAKRIYDVISEHGAVPLHSIKLLSGLNQKEDKSRFDRALTELQMRMFITMCARQQKRSKTGEAYGWYATVFTPVEQYFSDEVFKKAASLQEAEAANAIQAQIMKLNPRASNKTIAKFIKG